MAVKVMVAPAITKGELEKTETPAKRAAPASAKPKRRRSSVYDADGNEVFLTLMCLKCHKMRPLAQFGLRKMADGAIRNQPWCRNCRSGAGAEASRVRRPSGQPIEAELRDGRRRDRRRRARLPERRGRGRRGACRGAPLIDRPSAEPLARAASHLSTEGDDRPERVRREPSSRVA